MRRPRLNFRLAFGNKFLQPLAHLGMRQRYFAQFSLDACGMELELFSVHPMDIVQVALVSPE